MYSKLVLIFIVVLAPLSLFSQAVSSLRVTVRNHDTQETIADAVVEVMNTGITRNTDTNGVAEIDGIPDGEQTIVVSSLGYTPFETKLNFPLAGPQELNVLLELSNEVGTVTINSTRAGREIEDSPTRVEAIDEEEIDEKISMRPANVSMVLNESTGIKVQQTSATSNTQSIRIQGLDGRYTQLLKDGFPAFGGFSGSLSVLEIPPLDLKQVEVIKGPSATFYGGGAIAGVVNFITKDPEDDPVTTLLFNQTSALGTDFSIFNSRRFEKLGYTFLGSANFQKEYDVDDDDFTELPRIFSLAASPKALFYFDDKTRLTIGNSTSVQDRKGGDVFAIRGRADDFHRYFENNLSFRNISTFSLDRDLSNGGRVNMKQSLAFFDRKLGTPDHRFEGRQFDSYSDVSYFLPVKNHTLVFGATVTYDQFREHPMPAATLDRSETRTAVGGYVQDSVDITSKFAVEGGFRLDYMKNYGVFALPRISFLYRLTEDLTTRLAFGMGYKAPSIFTEDAEELLFRNVLPIGNSFEAERSQGGTFDINYRGSVGEKLSYSLNQLFFITNIDDPLILVPVTGGFYQLVNAAPSIRSRGFETNAKLSYGIAKLFAGYTFTDAKAGYLAGDQRLTLTPRHRINSAFVFEDHENFKAGVETYYTSSQVLDDRTRTRSIGELGLFAEKTLGKITVFFNAENLTDVRQGKYSPVVLPPHSNPSFAEIYTHTEGRIFNGGVKLRL